jgi:tetratricopeptide (TPR) repeat protein
MIQFIRSWLVVPVLLVASAPLIAQTGPGAELPGVNKPIKATSQKDLDHLEALTLYGQGLLHEKNHRLLEAVKAYEQAVRLDPDAVALHREIIPLYLALDRSDDALTEFRRVIELDPGDVEAEYLYARQLRAQNKTKESLAALKKAAVNEALKDKPGLRAQVFYDIGGQHEEAGEWLDAVKALREVAAVLDNPAALTEDGPLTVDEVNAQAAETWERIGRISIKAGQPDKAIAAFETAQKKDPAVAQRLAFNLAELNEKQGKFKEALAQIDNYLRMQPQGVEGYELKVKLLRKLARDADVPSELEAASKADPHNTALKLLVAREYRSRQPAKSEAIYLELIKESPSPDVFKGLVAIYKDDERNGATRLLGYFNEAVRDAGKKEEKNSANQAALARGLLAAAREDPVVVKRMLAAAEKMLKGPTKLAPATCQLLAFLAARTHQLAFAEELYRACLNDPNLPKEAEAEIYGSLLTVLMQTHKYDAVLDVCDKGLKTAEHTVRAMFFEEKARALMALNRSDEAIAAAKEARDSSGDKDRVLTRCNLAEIYSHSGKHEEAIAECQSLLKEYNLPDKPKVEEVRSIRLTLSSVYLAANKPDQSEKELQLLLDAQPNDALVNNNLGYQWAERNKNLDEAERMIRKALELDHEERGGRGGLDGDPDNAAYVDSLGWVLFRRGQLDAAREQLEKATGLAGGTDDPAVWDHLGDVYFRLEQKDKALAAFRKSLTLFEGNRRNDEEHKKEVEKKIKLLEP